MTAQVLPFTRRPKANPYEWGTPLWLAYRMGADAQDEKWRMALIGKLPPKREARP